MHGLVFRVSGLGFSVSGSGFRGSGFRGLGFGDFTNAFYLEGQGLSKLGNMGTIKVTM